MYYNKEYEKIIFFYYNKLWVITYQWIMLKIN